MDNEENKLNVLHKISTLLEDIKDANEKILLQAENQNFAVNKLPKKFPDIPATDLSETNKLLAETIKSLNVIIEESKKPWEAKLTLE